MCRTKFSTSLSSPSALLCKFICPDQKNANTLMQQGLTTMNRWQPYTKKLPETYCRMYSSVHELLTSGTFFNAKAAACTLENLYNKEMLIKQPNTTSCWLKNIVSREKYDLDDKIIEWDLFDRSILLFASFQSCIQITSKPAKARFG